MRPVVLALRYSGRPRIGDAAARSGALLGSASRAEYAANAYTGVDGARRARYARPCGGGATREAATALALSEAAVDGAVKAIVAAPAGQQRDTLNREIYSIARLVAGGAVPAPLAIESLRWAATQLRSYDARRPWRPGELDRMVRSAFADGLARPRQPERAA